MKHLRIPIRGLATATLALLAACGGGGEDGNTTTAPPNNSVTGYPASGAYAWTLKASGSSASLRHGLSLAHTAMPENEYVIETASQSITDTKLVVSGTVNAGQLTASGLQPHALLYIYGGDVRAVPLQADGTAPQSKVRRSNSSSACRFVFSAQDHAQPDNSRYIVSTAGADGVCGSADDGRAEVRLAGSGTLGYSILTGDAPLEVSRDPATLAPRGWITARQVTLWDAATPITLRAAGAPALGYVVGATPDTALVSDGSQLSLLRFSGAAAVNETPLGATLTAGQHWRLIGFDADAYYVYDGDPANTYSSTWRVLRIARTNPVATQIASGPGLISVASMGSNLIYLTVFSQNDNRLVRFSKQGGARTESTYGIDVKPSVQTGAAGRHQLWLVSGIGSANVSYAIQVIDESDATLYTCDGCFPMSVVETGSESFNTSENRTRFVFAQGFGARAYSGASIVSYDTLTGTARVLGTLPGASDYGNDVVFATATGGPTSAGAGFVTRSSNGTYVEQGAKVFSFDLGTANSLRTTSRR